MTTQTVPERPPAGSVESFVAIYRSRPGVENLLENRALGVIQGLIQGYYLTPAEKVAQIRNALAAAQQVREELAADPTGLLYTRADTEDDPTPVSPARGLHVGAVTDGGLVHETPDETPDETPRIRNGSSVTWRHPYGSKEQGAKVRRITSEWIEVYDGVGTEGIKREWITWVDGKSVEPGTARSASEAR